MTKTINVSIITNASLAAQFVLQDAETGKKQTAKNTHSANFQVTENHKYVLLIEVAGPSGSEYQIRITGATKATYPTGKLIITDGVDVYLARITG